MNERVTRPNQSIKSAVAGLLKGKVLVGHALSNDLKVLLLSHPHTAIRDTARCETRAPLHCLALSKLLCITLCILHCACLCPLFCLFRIEPVHELIADSSWPSSSILASIHQSVHHCIHRLFTQTARSCATAVTASFAPASCATSRRSTWT